MKAGNKDTGWAWNPDSKTKTAIARGNRAVARRRTNPSQPTEVKTMAQRKTASKKPATKKRTTLAKAAPARKTTNIIPLKVLLKDSDMDPRAARRRLRAAGIKGHDPRARWEFDKTTAAQARKVLEL